MSYCPAHGAIRSQPCPLCALANKRAEGADGQDGAELAGAPCSGNVTPLTRRESAQLEAAIILMKRDEIGLASRVLNATGKDEDLAAALTAYVAEHSPNDEGEVRL